MPRGGRLRATTDRIKPEHIPTGVDLAPGGYVVLTVEDNGEGMRTEGAARAFEPFYTAKEIGKGRSS